MSGDAHVRFPESLGVKFPGATQHCAMSKTRRSQERSDLRNATVDEGRPLEPTCRSRTQITFRCCVLTEVVVREGKGRKRNSGQMTSRKRTEREPPLSYRKELRRCRNQVVRRSWDKLRRSLFTGGTASGIQVG